MNWAKSSDMIKLNEHTNHATSNVHDTADIIFFAPVFDQPRQAT